MTNSHQNSLEKFLDPVTFRKNLVAAAVYLAAWEVLCTTIIDRIRSFMSPEVDEDGKPVPGDDYRTQVLSLHNERLTASMLWLQRNGAVDDADIAALDSLRRYRNQLAHELLKYLSEAEHEIDPDMLHKASHLAGKIARWWVLEFEVLVNPEYDGRTVRPEDVVSGTELVLRMMEEIASGEASADAGPDQRRM